MNEQYQTRFTTEDIIRTIFDAAYVGHPYTGLTRLFGMFNGEANPAPSDIAKPIPLSEAISLLIRSGMKPHTAKTIGEIVKDTLHGNMTGLYLLDKIKGTTDEFADGVTISNVDWSSRHFLGVSVGTPAIDFSSEPKILAALKSQVKTALEDYMSSDPKAFAKRPIGHRYDTATAKRA